MKAIALVHEGLEDISASEISETLGNYLNFRRAQKPKVFDIINIKTEIQPGIVIFYPNNLEEIALVCYKSQSVKRVIYLLTNFELNSIEDLKKSTEKIQEEAKKFFKEDMSFCVRCTKVDNDSFEIEDICLETAESLGINAKVNLKNPDLLFFVYINKKKCYIGIDFSGKELNKRDYRIYTHNESFKANICYSLLKIAGYNKKETILDPFCGTGAILVEAALYSRNLSHNFYSKDDLLFKKSFNINPDKFDDAQEIKGKIIGSDREKRHIINAEKNAKIAGTKEIEFFTSNIEDLEKKIPPKTIGKIITSPPNLTQRKNPQSIEKLYNEFFNQSNILLKDNGTITLITKTIDLIKNAAEKNNFSVLKESDIIIGDDIYKIFVFSKN